MKTVVFIGAHDLMVPYINSLIDECKVIVYESGHFSVPLSDAVILRKVPKKLFGLDRYLDSERSLPWYMSKVGSLLKTDKPDEIIVLDFIRFWYIQAVCYKIFHKSVGLHLYSETQRIPTTITSKIPFIFFCAFLFLTKKLLSTYFVFTNLGLDFAKRIGINHNVVLLPPPIDTNLFIKTNDKTFFKNQTLNILVNARFVAYKRHTDVFEAASMVLREGQSITLTCIGRSESSYLPQIKKFAKLSGVEKIITYLPPLPRESLPELYNEYDVLVLASDNEAIGMVVPEAMSCGIPTITSDSVGANVFVMPDVTGIVFQTKNVLSLVSSLRYFCNKQRLLEASSSAHEHIIKNYTIDTLSSILKDRLLK